MGIIKDTLKKELDAVTTNLDTICLRIDKSIDKGLLVPHSSLIYRSKLQADRNRLIGLAKTLGVE